MKSRIRFTFLIDLKHTNASNQKGAIKIKLKQQRMTQMIHVIGIILYINTFSALFQPSYQYINVKKFYNFTIIVIF